jgi:hypothetical protein
VDCHIEAAELRCVKCISMRVRCDFPAEDPSPNPPAATRPKRGKSPVLLKPDSPPKEPSKKRSRTDLDATESAPVSPVVAGPSRLRRRKSLLPVNAVILIH